jgi:hypothetical protein
MDRSTRRRRLGVLAIAVAGLAAAATSASPSPTPDLSSQLDGKLTVTKDDPVAWLDVRADETDALVAAAGATRLRIEAHADPGVLLIAEEVVDHSARLEGLGEVRFETSCPSSEPCGATIRLTAILVDPESNPSVDVTYTTTAETRFPPGKGPIPAAAVAVDVGEVETRQADALGLATMPPVKVELGPDVPRTVQTVHLTLPSGPTADATLAPAVLIRGEGTAYNAPVSANLTIDGSTVPVYWPSILVNPFTACRPLEPCDADLTLTFDWNGGAAEGASIDWSVAAWPGVAGEDPVVAPVVGAPVADDVAWDGPRLTASTSGQTTVTRNGGASVDIDATLDLSDVAQRAGGATGLIRMTFRAGLVDGSDPAANIGLTVENNVAVGRVQPGQEAVVYTRARDLACEARSACPVRFNVILYRPETNSPEATVDWTADIEFLPLTPAGLPDGATLAATRPSPRP